MTRPQKVTINSVDFITTLSKKRLVLVDNDQSILRCMILWLQYDYKLICFKNGYEALSNIEDNSNKVDLIITDNEMPKMSGSQMVIKLKSKDRLKHIPIIMQTGCASSSIPWNYLNCLLQKPVSKEVLLEAVKQALKESVFK